MEFVGVPKEQRWGLTRWEGYRVLMGLASCQERAAASLQGSVLTAQPGNIPASQLHGAHRFTGFTWH